MSNIIEIANDILKQVDIVDIISHYRDVIKKGRQYLCVCPFHDDSNPSLSISREKQIFTCFVCHTSGNAITFVMKYKHISYTEAVKEVCEIANIHDPRLENVIHSKPVDEGLQTLYNCTEELTKFYQYCLKTEEGKIALDYLHNRGINDEQIKKFQLGYALNDGTKTIKYLQGKGFSLKNIEDIGIAFAHANGTSDNNHGRLIFPIHDANGRVVGYSARRLTDNKDEAKFVNSPETKLFKKSQVLYNLSNALQEAKHQGYIYVVEGFMDVFALDSIGESSVIALMGTAFTKEAALTLKRMRVEVRLCLDGDLPGQQAMMKAMAILDKAQIDYRIVYQDGNIKDPDEILKQDGEAKLKLFINSLHDSFNFATSYYIRTGSAGSVDDRKKIINHFMPKLVNITDNFLLNDYISKLSKVTGFEMEAIRKLVIETKNKPIDNPMDNVEFNFPQEKIIRRRLQNVERAILAQMLMHKEAIEYYQTNIDCFVDKLYRSIAEYIVEYESNHKEMNLGFLINELTASEMSNKEQMVNEIVDLQNEAVNKEYKQDYMEDCKKQLIKEIQEEHNKNTLRQSIQDKDIQEKARLFAEYQKKNGKKH